MGWAFAPTTPKALMASAMQATRCIDVLSHCFVERETASRLCATFAEKFRCLVKAEESIRTVMQIRGFTFD
jgi:hypothetical protein